MDTPCIVYRHAVDATSEVASAALVLPPWTWSPIALLRRPLKWSSATGTVDAKLLDLQLTCPGRGFWCGWLFEGFVGMATRHLHNSKTLGQVCTKQHFLGANYQTPTGIWWNYILLTETSVGGRRGLVSGHVKINLFDCQIRISIYHRLQDNNSLVWNGKLLCTTED